jgi:hypothetical protein
MSNVAQLRWSNGNACSWTGTPSVWVDCGICTHVLLTVCRSIRPVIDFTARCSTLLSLACEVSTRSIFTYSLLCFCCFPDRFKELLILPAQHHTLSTPLTVLTYRRRATLCFRRSFPCDSYDLVRRCTATANVLGSSGSTVSSPLHGQHRERPYYGSIISTYVQRPSTTDKEAG